MEKIIRSAALLVVAVMIFACLPLASSAADYIIKDGLAAYYDGANNSNGKQDMNATVWRDLSGNGLHFEVQTDDTTKWTKNAFHSDRKQIYFNDGVLPVVNGNFYTIEMAFGEMEFYGTDWLTLVASDNDEFSMFIRVQDGLDQIEYKYNDNNRDRPMCDNGKDLVNNSTLAITFELSDDVKICKIYIDGVVVAQGVPTVANIANSLFFGHGNEKRAWQGDIYAFRFYDRVLSEEEIRHNSAVDDDKYRSGKDYNPEQEATDTAEIETRPYVEYKPGDVITVADFSDPATCQKALAMDYRNCNLEMDESGALKVTVTGADPYFYIPIDRTNSFSGEIFSTLIFTYKTGTLEDDFGQIYFSTTYQQVYWTDCVADADFSESKEFRDYEINMKSDNYNDNWQNDIIMLRIDVCENQNELGQGQEYWFKSVKARYDDQSAVTEAPTEAPTKAIEETHADPANTDAPKENGTKAVDTKPAAEPEKSNAGWIIGIICGVAGVAAIVAVVMIVLKKKKK